jgi:hypothetical protein
MPGLMDDTARRTRAETKLPKFRANRPGHRRIVLTQAQAGAAAAALSRHPDARRYNVVRARPPRLSPHALLRQVIAGPDVHLAAEAFYATAFQAGGAVRFPFRAAGVHAGRITSEHSQQCDFQATARETGVANALAGRVLYAVRVSLTHTALARIRLQVGPENVCDVSGELVLANVYNVPSVAHRSFGYTAIDNRYFQEAFIPAVSVGGPIAIVRSPRALTPRHIHWVIETHATSRTEAWGTN